MPSATRACVSMSPREHALEVDAERRRTPERAQPPGERMAVALRHLAFGRGREAHAELAEALQLRVVERVAVHDVDVVAEQARGLEPLPAVGRARRAAALVQRGDEAELARHAEVVQRDLERRVVRAEDRGLDRSAGRDPGAPSAGARPRRADAALPRTASRPASDRAWACRGRTRRGCPMRQQAFDRARRCAPACGCCGTSRRASSCRS